MKKRLKIIVYLITICISFLILAVSCKKDNDDTITLKDIDGNVYKTVTIGTQVWMKENLKVTKLNDGTAIQLVIDDKAWSDIITPAYCWYDNEESTYKNSYGALYNWFAVNTGKLCPTGWHVPSDEELTTISNFAGGNYLAGGNLKEAGTEHWESPNTGATNESGFTAIPGGYRSYLGIFEDFGIQCFWWSSTEYANYNAVFRSLFYSDTRFMPSIVDKETGFSVRCIKD